MAMLDYSTNDATINLHCRQAERLRSSITDELMPWANIGPRTAAERIAAMRERYVRRFADPRSEKGKKAVAKQLRIWEEQKRGRRRARKRKLVR